MPPRGRGVGSIAVLEFEFLGPTDVALLSRLGSRLRSSVQLIQFEGGSGAAPSERIENQVKNHETPPESAATSAPQVSGNFVIRDEDEIGEAVSAALDAHTGLICTWLVGGGDA